MNRPLCCLINPDAICNCGAVWCTTCAIVNGPCPNRKDIRVDQTPTGRVRKHKGKPVTIETIYPHYWYRSDNLQQAKFSR